MTEPHEPSVGGWCDSEIYLECSCGWQSNDPPYVEWFAHLPDSLDAAWAEAEAALPEGWCILSLSDNRHDGTWQAWAGRVPDRTGDEWEAEEADTPAAALRALAMKLREAKG